MALPILSGQATIWAIGEGKPTDIALEHSKGGTPMAKFSASFQKAKKDEYDEWQVQGKINVRVTAFGPLAEYVAKNFHSRDKADVQIETELAEFTTKSGEDGKAVQGILRAIGAPFKPKNDGYSNGGGEYG